MSITVKAFSNHYAKFFKIVLPGPAWVLFRVDAASAAVIDACRKDLLDPQTQGF